MIYGQMDGWNGDEHLTDCDYCGTDKVCESCDDDYYDEYNEYEEN